MIVSPSLLSADFCNLSADIDMINRSEAELLHLDIMDGVFVPNISFGFPVIKNLKNICTKGLDVHLMIVEPQKFIKEVKDAGAEYMNVHYEACQHLSRVIQQIKEAGMKAGVTLNPATPVAVLEDVICDIDMALIMSVNPGFGGQKFIESTFGRVERLNKEILSQGADCAIEVDGGVSPDNASALADAGADILVAGSSVFRAADPAAAIRAIRG